ncbi:MAG: phosphoribosylanthranilate isomerase [Verrucomicrobia bacterium]|nr:phosphoribosylanthranilate isomerase [Verrucomicrobiota bacterium]
MRPRIKICGLTRPEDAKICSDLGVDAIGLMFYAGSKRHVTLEQACAVVSPLAPFVARVGVFVNPAAGEVREAVARCGLSAVQLHGEETPEFCRQFAGLNIIKAFRVRDRTVLENLPHFQISAWLLDAHVEGAHGGTGARFDWDIAAEATALGKPVILAGGMNPDNVADAVRRVRPYGVDVSSGVESAPGLKDVRKIEAFLKAVSSAG